MTGVKTVLLALHTDGMRQELQAHLEISGILTMQVDNGFEALAALMNFRPDAAILSTQLAKIDGVRVSQLLRDVEELREVQLLLIGPPGIDPAVLEELHPIRYTDSGSLEEILPILIDLDVLPSLEVEVMTPIVREKPSEPVQVDPLARVAELLEKGNDDEAADILRQYTDDNPDDLKGWGYLQICFSRLFRRARDELQEFMESYPLKGLTDRQIMGLSLRSDEGFLLSFVDGKTRLRELFYLSGYDRVRTYILIRQLMQRGVILLDSRRK